MLSLRPLKLTKLWQHSHRFIARRRLSTQKKHDPLRILFCGADDFSIYSLRALHQFKQERPETIASIDVVCRPDKRVGRGLKEIQEVPIKRAAQKLELPLHQIDTFTGWTPAVPADLVVAVSFGLLVPSRILKGATHGGLNVHPSLLPDLRGPAPIQHALLKERTHTGVSVQTMHPTRFDHGLVLAQTPKPGIEIPEEATVQDMVDLLGRAGAELLRDSIEEGLFLSPQSIVENDLNLKPDHAPKITPEDRHIDWSTYTADRIKRYDRILGKLWDTTTYVACFPKKGVKRMTFSGPWCDLSLDTFQDKTLLHRPTPGLPTLSFADGLKHPRLAIVTADKKAVKPQAATVEGEQRDKALLNLVNALRNR